MICSQENLDRSLSFLTQVLASDKLPKLLTMDCFLMLKESSNGVETDWSHSIAMSKEELQTQLHFDLGCFFFFKENYTVATTHFTRSKQAHRNLQNITGFATVDVEDLDGYILACTGADAQKDLQQQFRTCIANHYMVCSYILIERS